MLEQPAFGQRLRAMRVKRGLSQADLVGDALSPGYLSRLESGSRRPTTRVVAHLAQRLGVSVSEFESAEDHGSGRTQASALSQVLAAVVSATDGEDLADTLAEALRAEGRLDPVLRWQALWLLARMYGTHGRHEEARPLLAELVTLSDELGTPVLQVRSRTQLSRCLRDLGDNARAREYASEAYRSTADLSVVDRAATMQVLVSTEAEMGFLAEARVHADELCALAAPVGGTLLVEALWSSATVRMRQGDHVGAQQALEQALLRLDSRDDLILWIRLRLAAASLYLQANPSMTEQARARLDEVSPLLDVIGTELHKQQLLTLRAHLAFEEHRIDEARALCAGIDQQTLLLSFRDHIRFRALCGRLMIIDGDRDGGISLLHELAQQAQDALNVELAAEIWRALAETLAEDHDRRPVRRSRHRDEPSAAQLQRR
ncbi:helix-turn-helix domain-containing protein [Planosporangium sp. 12N6]|uniref:helix-turn-helix domain-containing protein n=1 Tax=Planosporangium spinosum TaxID=3402278 RepID=UPI003CEE67FC